MTTHSSLKVIIECSKCWGNWVGDLMRVFKWDDGIVYEYEAECMNCRVGISCVLSEIDKAPGLPRFEVCEPNPTLLEKC